MKPDWSLIPSTYIANTTYHIQQALELAESRQRKRYIQSDYIDYIEQMLILSVYTHREAHNE